MSVPITKETIEQLYYKWWLEICKSVTPEVRNHIRCALSIIEAYRSDLMYGIVYRIYRNDVAKQDFDVVEWEARIIESVKRTMENDKKRIKTLAKYCPNLLIGIAGVINGVRRSYDARGAFNTILLLDVVDSNTIDQLESVELENIRFIQESKSIYLPLRGSEVYSVIEVVEKMLADNDGLYERVNAEYHKRKLMLSSVLGIQVELAEAA